MCHPIGNDWRFLGRRPGFLGRGGVFGQSPVEATLPKHIGKIVGVVDMIDCVHVIARTRPDGQISWSCEVAAMRRYPWLLHHRHTSGPFCHIYANARPFAEPIPYRGAQGFFEVPDHVVAEALARC